MHETAVIIEHTVMHCGHGVTSNFKVWSRGHSRISVDTNCVPGLSRISTTPMGVTTPCPSLVPRLSSSLFVLKVRKGWVRAWERGQSAALLEGEKLMQAEGVVVLL